MKIAVTGKGGVGKTTLAGTMARIFAAEGYRVLAVDADPDANLASALGISADIARGIVPIADMKDLIAERTGATPGSMGGFFKINPRVDDIPDELSVPLDGIRLMVMGTVKEGAGGCVCPESVLLRSLIRHLLLRRDEVVILDMEAGIEHLGRGTAQGVDAMIVVVEAGARSARTADAIRRLADDIGIKRLFVVLNKVDAKELEQLKSLLTGFQIIGSLPFSPGVRQADLDEAPPFERAPEYVEAVRSVVAAVRVALDSDE
ncbi:MAG: AAA family ATPase [Actinobacteria bacterium]|nr:AAA family ATPase [Actinomycetota bacterium]